MAFKTAIDKTALSTFLAEAVEKGSYASIEEVRKTLLQDGTDVIGPYTSGPWSYTDRYKGSDVFSGVEEVSFDGKPVWKRFYKGGITDRAHVPSPEMSKVYGFLKEALRHYPKEKPFMRGPNIFKKGEYEYLDLCSGDAEWFKGKERIFHNKREVYVLDYFGGMVTE